jgi:hypothetical protein
MLKQTSSKMKQVLAISFAVLFVASLTAVTASAHGSHGGGARSLLHVEDRVQEGKHPRCLYP